MIPELQLPSPALHWTDGHVLGNGNIGAVVWGTPEHLCIGLSKHDVNDLRVAEPHGARLKAAYPEIRDRVMQGQRDIRGIAGGAGTAPRTGQQQLACGRLTLELLRGVQPLSFAQTLSLEKATVTVEARPTLAGWTFGMTYKPVTAGVFVAADRNVLLVELHSESEQHVRWTYDRSLDPERPPPTFTLADDASAGLMQHSLPHGMGYAVAIAAGDHRDVLATANAQGLVGTIAFGGGLGSTVLAVGLASTFEAGKDPVADSAVALVAGLNATTLNDLRDRHSAWWRDFWGKSAIQYGHEELERLWYAGLYAMGSSTRPQSSPPNLQGLWVQDEISPWHTDFHFNTNIQQCQWGACGSNHPELQEALLRLLTEEWSEELKRAGREVYGVDAPALNLATDWLGRAISSWGFLELSVTAWTAQNVWEHYLHTQDVEMLRNGGYDFLRDCAQLYLGLLVDDAEGQLNIELSHSPEQIWFDDGGRRYFAYGRNPTIDISCIRTLFESVVAGSHVLRKVDPVADAAKDALKRLPPLPVHGGVLADYEIGFFHDGDRPGTFPHCHRHPSRLMPVFPGRQIGLHSPPETLDLGRRSFREFRSYGEEGFTGWSYAYQACIAARLGLAEDAEQCLERMCEGFLLKGMLTSHNSITPGVGNYELFQGSPLFQIDALLGSVAAVNEMLVQRTPDGVIRVFPALPAGRPASFDSLRVPGAALVSASRDADGVEWISVCAEQAGEIALASPWPGGAAVTDHAGVRFSIDENVLQWSATPGTAYRFTPPA